LVTADPNKLKQVIINLIMNAVHAMQGHGKIVLRTSLNLNGMLELQVEDDGPGIDPDLQEQVFAPFFTTKSEGEGTGLGLYICRNIINGQGGSITLESQPGEGTIFRICLPVS
jgi:signal transduction histidine kinase